MQVTIFLSHWLVMTWNVSLYSIIISIAQHEFYLHPSMLADEYYNAPDYSNWGATNHPISGNRCY